MAIYDRATSAVSDSDKFEVCPVCSQHLIANTSIDTQMFTIYIAKASSNYGLPANSANYERAIETLPDKQTAEMCLRFALMERKLGEIDRARAIYAQRFTILRSTCQSQFLG